MYKVCWLTFHSTFEMVPRFARDQISWCSSKAYQYIRRKQVEIVFIELWNITVLYLILVTARAISVFLTSFDCIFYNELPTLSQEMKRWMEDHMVPLHYYYFSRYKTPKMLILRNSSKTHITILS